MRHFERNLTSTFVVLALLLFFPGYNSAHADFLDLGDYYAFPSPEGDFYHSDPVRITVSSNGLTAILTEDPGHTPVLLSNDPYCGDPHVILPEIGGVGQILFFDFDFVEPGGPSVNNDEFGVFIIDNTGYSPGPAWEFYVQNTASGTVSFDLSSLSGPTYEPLGLQFQLSALPGDVSLDSTLTISNVRLVPVPGAVLLACIGMGMSAMRLRRTGQG